MGSDSEHAYATPRPHWFSTDEAAQGALHRMVEPMSEHPSDLGPQGVRAFALASRHVASLPEPERFHDVVLRFARVVDLVDEVRREWIDHGRPELTECQSTVVP